VDIVDVSQLDVVDVSQLDMVDGETIAAIADSGRTYILKT
jgi:hypothetical protein